jgi:hypothetical protein
MYNTSMQTHMKQGSQTNALTLLQWHKHCIGKVVELAASLAAEDDVSL